MRGSMAPKSEESPLTRQELAFIEDMKTKPDEWFWETLFRIESRDYPGKLVALKMNAAQRLYDDFEKRALRLNLQMQVDAFKQGQPTYIHPDTMKAHIERGAPVPEHMIGLSVLIGKSRRGGFSTRTLAKGMRRILTTPNYSCLLMAHADDSAMDIWGIGHRMYDHWPNQHIRCRPDAAYDSSDYFELEGIESRYAVSTSGKNVEAESKRGWRFDFMHFSEYAHYKSYSDATQVLSARMPYSWVIKESTANGKSGPFYEEWRDALTIDEAEEAYRTKDYETLSKWGTPGQYKFFFSWLDDPGLVQPVFDGEESTLIASLDEYERALMARDKRFTLGRVKERRARIRDSKAHPILSPEQLFMQEFPATPEEMFQVTGSPVFDEARIELCAAQAKRPRAFARVFASKPPLRVVESGCNLRIYEPFKPGHAYVIGADVSKGVGKDYSVGMVFDRCDGTRIEEVALFRSNTTNEHDFGHILTMLGEMYGGAFIVPEINQGLLAATTVVTENRYWNVYERQTFDAVNMDPSTNTFRFGFFTSMQTKSMVVQATRSAFREGLVRVHSHDALGEMRIFQVDADTQKYGVPKGSHDDIVIAICLGWHGARFAPSLEYAAKRAEKTGAADPAQMSRMERMIFEAIQRKTERSIRAAKRGPDFRPAIK